jgi:hypothetical protein
MKASMQPTSDGTISGLKRWQAVRYVRQHCRLCIKLCRPQSHEHQNQRIWRLKTLPLLCLLPSRVALDPPSSICPFKAPTRKTKQRAARHCLFHAFPNLRNNASRTRLSMLRSSLYLGERAVMIYALPLTTRATFCLCRTTVAPPVRSSAS